VVKWCRSTGTQRVQRFGLALLLAWAVGLGICEAKDYLIVSWQFDDDLPRDGINSITQGKDGYLWVSSRFGLARTDGARFTDFTAKVGAQFLGYHYAYLTTDNSGAVWISTPGGGVLRWRDRQLEMCAKAGNPVFGPVVAGLTNSAGDNVAVTPDGRVVGWGRSTRVGDGRSGVAVAPDGRAVSQSNGVAQLVVDASRWGEPVPQSICQGKEGTVWWITYQHKLVQVSGLNAEELVWGSGNEQRNWIAL